MVQHQQIQPRSSQRIQRAGFAETRHAIERLRLQSDATGVHFAVISLDCTPTLERPLDRILEEIDDLDELLRTGWVHEFMVGWVGRDRLAVVLPNASPIDAWQYANEIRLHCKADESSVQVYANHDVALRLSSSERIRIPSIDGLLRHKTLRWKRILDVLLATLGLLVATPFLMVAAAMVKATTRGPIFFRQNRVGYGGKPFAMYKLRTMRQDADEIKDELREHNEVDGLGFKIVDDPRVTTVGRILRKTSLDELPQLLNVIRGEMSLVGPRPLPCDDWHPTDLWMNARHDVKPGITCTWQIKGRSSVSFEEWMLMDIEYIESMNFASDVRLLAQTIPAVLSQRGAS